MSYDNDAVEEMLMADWGLDYLEASRPLKRPPRPVQPTGMWIGWPVALLCASVSAAVGVRSYYHGTRAMRVWVDDWTGGPN